MLIVISESETTHATAVLHNSEKNITATMRTARRAEGTARNSFRLRRINITMWLDPYKIATRA
ncbi:MAG TPA: hypothetical protein DIS66_00985 [Candidatus Omnitrophica bacterium]|nr:hypothetical protein [Candidatus Omnitrophota bacterium]